MKLAKAVLPLLFLLTVLVPHICPGLADVGGAPQLQRDRDPLNPKEADELREAAQEPDKRLKLLTQFARARLQSIEQMRGDPKLEAERGPQVHNMLEDFTALVDELDDNIDDFADRHNDERKGLKAVIEAATEFQLKLRTLKEQSAGNESSDYSFVLQNAIEAVNTNLDNARKTLEEQETEFKEAKKKKK